MAHDLTTPSQQPTGAANTPTPGQSAATLNNVTAAASAGANPVRPGGAPARMYMNEKIVPYLLEGMKSVAREQYA